MKWYGNAQLRIAKGEMNLSADTIKVMLLANTYVPDQDAHQVLTDVSSHQVTGAGYTAGGQALANKALTYDAVNNKVIFDADDLKWLASTITARYAVLFDDTHPSDALLAYVDFGADKSTSSTDFIIQWNAGGIGTITVS